MKNNTMKRVLAGTLAVLTVAAYVPANVGGFLTGSTGIVAQARDEAVVVENNNNALAPGVIEKGDYFEGDVYFNKPESDQTTNYQIKLPYSSTVDSNFDVIDQNNSSPTPDGDDGIVTISNINSIKYEAKDTSGNDCFKLTVEAVDPNNNNTLRTYTITMKYNDTNQTYANFCANHFIRVKDVAEGDGSVTYTLKVEETKKTVSVDYADVADYIQSIDFTNKNGQADTANVVSSNSVAVAYKTMVTVKSTAKLKLNGEESNADAMSDFLTGYNNGVFTYEFNALDPKTFALDKQALIVDASAEGVTGTEKAAASYQVLDKEATDLTINIESNEPAEILQATIAPNNATKIPVGALVTVTSPTMFTIANAAITGINDKNEFTTGDVSAVYKDGKFTATFNFSGEPALSGDTTTSKYQVCFVKLAPFPTDLEYTITKNVITANTKDGVTIKNAEVASAYAETWVPEYKAGATTKEFGDIKVDADGNQVYTKTKLADSASTPYNKDQNAMVKINFAIDNVLTGKSGTSAGVTGSDGKSWEVTLTKDNKTVGTLYYKQPTGSTAEPQDGLTFVPKNADGTTDDTALSGNNAVSKLAELGFRVDNVGSEGPVYEVSSSKLVLVNRNAGVYKATLTVWDATNTANAKTATYNWTVSPATDVTEEDIEFTAYYTQGYKKAKEEFDEIYRSSHDGQLPDVNDTLAYEAYEKALNDAPSVKENVLSIEKNANGVYVVSAEEEKLKDDNVTLTAALKDGTDCAFSGGNTLGKMNYTEKATLEVNDPNYNIKPITVQWSLTEKAVEDSIYFDAEKAGYTDVTTVDANGNSSGSAYQQLQCTFEDLETILKRCLFSTNDIDTSKVTFKYTIDKALGDDIIDIDALTNGLPDASLANDDNENRYDDYHDKYYGYTDAGSMWHDPTGINIFVYATVGSYETEKPICINLRNATETIDVYAVLAKDKFTYGETIQPEDIAFVKAASLDTAGTKEFVAGLTPAEIAFNGITIKRIADADGNKVTNSPVIYYDSVYSMTSNEQRGLTPGTYTAIFNTSSNGISLAYDDDKLYTCKVPGTTDDTNTTALRNALTTTFVVEKKQLDSSMLDKDIEVQIEQNGGKATVTDTILTGKITGVVSNDGLAVTIKSGDSSATKPGKNTVTIAPSGDSAKLYTGTCEAVWYAVEDADAGFELVDDGSTDNVYDDEKYGVTIHFEGSLNITKGDFNEATATPTAIQNKLKELKISKFGKLIAKKGEFARDADLNEVRRSLRLDSEISTIIQTNATLKNSNGLKTGVNSTVSSMDDYLWEVTYAVTETGHVVYSDPRMIDFATVSADVVQPKLDKTQLVQKNDSLYYYAYATKKSKTPEDNVKTVEPTFGVVISRTGNYATIPTDRNTLERMKQYLKYCMNGGNLETNEVIDYLIQATIHYEDSMTPEAEAYGIDSLSKAIKLELSEGTAFSKVGFLRSIDGITTENLTTYFGYPNADNDDLKRFKEDFKATLTNILPFIEEVENTAATLSLDNCDVSSKAIANNANYTEDECGTLVRIADSQSNVYVATYTDFGNGMVALSDVKVIPSASATLANAVQLRTFEGTATDTGKYYMQARRNKNTANSTEGIPALDEFTTMKGKKQTFEAINLRDDELFTEFGLLIDKNNTAKAYTDMTKDAGFLSVQSKKPNENTVAMTGITLDNRQYDVNPNSNYTIAFGAATAEANKGTSARAYAIYKGVPIYAPNWVQNESPVVDNNYIMWERPQA